MKFEFVESSLFTKAVKELLPDEDYLQLQQYLMLHPEAGSVVRGSGGVRKLRWSRPGTGKSSGVRVCYYLKDEFDQIWMLVIYPKSVADSIPGHILRQLKEELLDE